jgi:hypothetical protein
VHKGVESYIEFNRAYLLNYKHLTFFVLTGEVTASPVSSLNTLSS